MKTPITVAHGDGIGPEIMDATLRILSAGGAELELDQIEIGEAVYRRGFSSGIEPSAWDSLRRTRVFLKAPITTPQGGGVKSLNVTVRKTLGLFANVRPCVSYHPFVGTKDPGMDVVIVRENEEDLYAGIEHRQTEQVYQSLKLVSVPGSERIIRYAFEYARVNKRKRITCLSKDNIMKLTDGLFHKTFERIAREYPDIQSDHWIVDIGAAKLAFDPASFDTIVTLNLYGDIISDIVAQLAGSVGLAGSANVGENCAMFEAIHGSAPKHAGKNTANPSGLLMGAVMMLVHIGQGRVAERVHNAWLRTLEDGVHTRDIFSAAVSKRQVGTKEFAEAVIERLGQIPVKLKPASYAPDGERFKVPSYQAPLERQTKVMIGVDVFIDSVGSSPEELSRPLMDAAGADLQLSMIGNRGVKVWPDGAPETFCSDHWRCRFDARSGVISHQQIVDLLRRINEHGLDFIKIETLCTFNGEPGFSLGQGE